MKRYFDIWPLEDGSVQRACQITGLDLRAINISIIEKYREGVMVREGDGPFYLRNVINQALRDQNINVRMG